MPRLRQWLTRHDERAETQRAVVVLLCAWFGCGVSALLTIWGVVTHEWVTLFQGLALLGLGLAVLMRNRSS